MDDVQILYQDLSIVFELFNFPFDTNQSKETPDYVNNHSYIFFNGERIKLFELMW